jgi:integrase/recombinase XerD
VARVCAQRALDASTETDLQAYAVARHAGTRATSANRRLTVFKRYFAGRCASG